MEYSRCANNVGVTALFMGEAGQAQSYFDRALDYFPQNPNALLNLRTIVLKKQSEADADAADAFREQANQLLREAQQSAQALRLEGADPLRLAGAFGFVYSESFSLWAATQYARAGNPRLQMAALAQARAINPDSEGVHFGEASVAIGAGEVEKAMAEYEAVLKADPDSIPGRIGLAVLLHSQGQTTRALDVLEADETNLDTTRLLSARAMLHAEAGHLDAAKQLFLAAMARKDRDSQSNGFLAIAAFRLGDIENTRALAESTLAREPHLTNLMRILVIVEKNDGKLQRALTWLRLLRAQSPKNVSLLEEIIDVSMRLNDASEAQQASESLLALDPGNFLAHFALAILADQKDAYSVAEKHLRACLQHPDHPTYPRVVNNLAYCLIQQGRAADALPLARQAVQLDSTNANCFHTLAHAQWLGGNLAEAEEAILHARILAPGDPNHQVLHAEILLAAGRKDEARELAAKTITSAQDKWRTRAQKVLDEAGP
jgi:tetratricopeptide (TPR) repeat protein